MKLAKGPRPWPIHVFAVLLLTAGLIDLVRGLSYVGNYNFGGFNPLTGEKLSDDALIVLISAQFTIVCIPVIAIWLFGSSIARWLVAFFVILGAASFVVQVDARYFAMLLEHYPKIIGGLASKFATWLGVALLFLPQSSRWFSQKPEVDHATFE